MFTATDVLFIIIFTFLAAFIAGFLITDEIYHRRGRATREAIRDLRASVASWRHWCNVYKDLYKDALRRNTLIINELPKGDNIPKYGDE